MKKKADCKKENNRMHLKIPKLFCRGEITNFSKEDKTVTMVWATGSQVIRNGFWGDQYLETLSMEPNAIRLGRLISGAPVLDSHMGYALRNQIGVVESAWIEDNKGFAKVRFSDRPEVAWIVNDVSNKIIRNVSVGYVVHKYKDISQEEDKIKRLLAVDWEPYEISLVTMPADPEAKIREGKQELFPVVIEERKVMSSEIEKKEEKNETGQKVQSEVDIQSLRNAAIIEERERIASITTLVRKAGLPQDFLERMIAEGISLDQAREQILNALIERSKVTQIKNNVCVEVGPMDETITRREAVQNCLLHRFNSTKYPLIESAQKYRSLSLLEIARRILEWRGEKIENLSKGEISIRALHSTSDFPSILSSVASKTLLDGYQSTPQTFLPFVRFVTAVDFKPIYRVSLGEAPQLEKIEEGGEFKHGSMKEGGENYKIDTHGKIIGITRKAIINDDLGAFTRIPFMFGVQAANLESDLFWKIITNGNMSDGTPLFHESHKNLAASGGKISLDALSNAREAMMTHKGLDGKTIINVIPTHLVVPAKLMTTAQQHVASIVAKTANKVSEVNPFAGALEVVAEPRLDLNSVTAWYVFSSATLIDMVEIATLDGTRGPTITTEEGFDIDGIRIKASYDIGGAPIDYRGFYKNPGAQ